MRISEGTAAQHSNTKAANTQELQCLFISILDRMKALFIRLAVWVSVPGWLACLITKISSQKPDRLSKPYLLLADGTLQKKCWPISRGNIRDHDLYQRYGVR